MGGGTVSCSWGSLVKEKVFRLSFKSGAAVLVAGSPYQMFY